jgi:large subunit ribosomal protein L30
MNAAKKLKVTQIKSLIGHPERQKQTIKALGLRRIRHSVVHRDTPQVRGMIEKVKHLIQVEEV